MYLINSDMASRLRQTANDAYNKSILGENTNPSITSNLLSGVGGLASAGLTAYQTYADVNSPGYFIQRANNYQLPGTAGLGSFDDWTQAYLNNSKLKRLNWKTDVGYNSGKATRNTLGAAAGGAAAGASIGSIIPGLGTLAGGLIGGVLGGIGGLFSNSAAKRKAQRTAQLGNDALAQVENYNDRLLDNNLSTLKMNQFGSLNRNYIAAYGGPLGMIEGPIDYSMAMQYLDMKNNAIQNKLMADGGQLHSHGSDWNTGLNYVGNGGSHEENPYDGVPMGIAPDGQPNLVEEGEVIWNNDYVFSKRLKVPKAIRNKYKLGGPKPISFADAAIKANKEAEERPNDPITLRGRDATLGALAEAQEVQRAKKEAKEQPEGMPMLEGVQPIVAANGGAIHIDKNKRGTFTAAASRHGKSVQEFASQVLANPENYSPAMRKKANFARNAAKWHGSGGHLFFPGGNLAWPYPYREDDDRYDGRLLPWTANLTSKDWLNKFNDIYGASSPYNYHELPETTIEKLRDTDIKRGVEYSLIPSAATYINTNVPRLTLNDSDTTQGVTRLSKATQSKLNPNNRGNNSSWLTGLRYIPAIGAGIGVFSDLMGWTNKPDYSQADAIARAARGMGTISASPIGDYLTYRPMDRMFALNMLNANAGANRRAILDTAGGNRGTAMAGLLASDNNTLNNIGNLFRQAEEYNAQQREKVATFNRATNMFNSELDFNAQKANLGRDEVVMRGLQAAAAMRDAIDQRVGAAKSANLTNFLQSVGDIGWEAFNRNMINSNRAMYYTIDSTGNIKYKDAFYSLPREMQDVLRERAEIDKRVKSLGGILNKRRR